MLASAPHIGHPAATKAARRVVMLLRENGRAAEAASIDAQYGDKEKLLSYRAS